VDNKNQSFLVDTVAVLLKRGYKVKLDLLGDGPDRAKVENKIKEEGLSSQVFCHGIVNNVEDYLHNADIYVHSAFSEAFGLVLLEAMAAGLPVVCLDGKGNRDIMREKYNGFMIPKPDVELFAEKIIQLINDKDLYAHISENAESFAKDYDIKAYVEKLMQIYKVCKKA
jgi:glycosyltransferase involved in cell wall biosynthesis